MAERPTVSIGLPVYNGENYLRQAIECVLAQSFGDLELVISDNASTDATAEICAAYASRDRRVRYVRNARNVGAAENYNRVFMESRGKYFKWHAHDDLISPNFIERCVSVLDGDAGCVLAVTATHVIDECGQVIAEHTDLADFLDDSPSRRLRSWLMQGLPPARPFFGLMRREVAAATGLHGTYPGCDRVFVAEMALRGRVRVVPESLCSWRIHKEQYSRSVANVLHQEEWHTGRRGSGIRFKYLRLVREFMAAINAAPLSRVERLRAAKAVLGWAWIVRLRVLAEMALPFWINGEPTILVRWLLYRRGNPTAFNVWLRHSQLPSALRAVAQRGARLGSGRETSAATRNESLLWQKPGASQRSAVGRQGGSRP